MDKQFSNWALGNCGPHAGQVYPEVLAAFVRKHNLNLNNMSSVEHDEVDERIVNEFKKLKQTTYERIENQLSPVFRAYRKYLRDKFEHSCI